MSFNEQNVFIGRARLRAKDIREALKNSNLDHRLIHILEGLADNDKTNRDQIAELATYVDRCIDTVNRLLAVITKISEKFPDIDTIAAQHNAASATGAIKDVAQAGIKLQEPEET